MFFNLLSIWNFLTFLLSFFVLIDLAIFSLIWHCLSINTLLIIWYHFNLMSLLILVKRVRKFLNSIIFLMFLLFIRLSIHIWTSLIVKSYVLYVLMLITNLLERIDNGWFLVKFFIVVLLIWCNIYLFIWWRFQVWIIAVYFRDDSSRLTHSKFQFLRF